uniref:Uncharacterized protein n=1 Tax=Schizaphis graminum TaxID=13262 RepID=A0A2S2PIL2_SCHGA
MPEVDRGTRYKYNRSEITTLHRPAQVQINVYILSYWHVRRNNNICITIQYGGSLLQHWSSFCRVAGRYTPRSCTDQRSSAGLVQIIYITYYNILHNARRG